MASYGQAQLLPPNGTTEGGGSVLLPNLAPIGTPLVAAAENVQPSMAACIGACRLNKQCSAVWFCEAQGGCSSAAYNLSAPYHGCQLIDQVVTRPGTGRPVLLVAAPTFTGGAPLRYAAPQIEGYEAHPGLGLWYRYDLTNCADSISQPGSCGLEGGPQQAMARCDEDPACQVMVWFPDGRDYPGPGKPVVLLKGGQDVTLDITDANINLNAVLYKKMALHLEGAGGLTAGAIAGIVIGACCGAGLVVAAGIFMVRWRRRQRQAEGCRADEDMKAAGSGLSEALSKHSGVEVALCGTGSGSSSYFTCIKPAPLMTPSLTGPPAQRATHLAQVSVPVNTAGSLPPGDLNSMVAARPAKALAPCPVTPLPTAGNSVMTGCPVAFPRHASTVPSPPQLHILSHLPTYGWQRCVVDFSAIQFVCGTDGSPQELGAGASATVYRVLLNGVEPHAAKVFRLGSDPQAALYFLEEASTLRLLRHKHVVGFAGVCVEVSSGIILMELMEGGDLRSRNRELDENGRRLFGWHQRGWRVALDVALALNYLHASSYTHFDVKASNVLLSRDVTAKLADVGFARAIRSTHHSIEGPTGTFDYMAPELLTGRKCNSSVDIYSLGVLLWELCTGEYPSRGSMREPRVPQECPQQVADLIQECLQEEAAARPTVRQVVERLTQLQ